ncbi:MAG: tetratricopeptide repeat protein [Pseudomonadota bacterium]
MRRKVLEGFALASVVLLVTACETTNSVVTLSTESTQALVQYGQTDFDATGAPEAHSEFLIGLLQLHNFEYADARNSFQRALAIDPEFVMATWGEALTHWHPLWPTSNIEAAREIMSRLGSTSSARIQQGQTERERDYLRTLEILLEGDDRQRARERYSDALLDLKTKYPDDLDAAAFYALSLLARSGGRKPFFYMRAGAVTEEILDRNPLHPGALHYNIHSYDDPIHAPLGLRAARDYIKVAPSAVHALHMGAHIFYPLAMWDEGVGRNKLSFHEAVSRQSNPDDRYHPETFHSLSWLPYGLQQQKKYDEALEYIALIARQTELYPSFKMARMHYVEARASFIIDTEDWDHPLSSVVIDHSDLSPYSQITDLYLAGVIALQRGDLESAESALSRMRNPQVPLTGRRTNVAPALLQMALTAQIAMAEGDHDAALRLLKRAADIETNWPLDVGPPQPVQPMAELLGDVYRELGNVSEARKAYELSLEKAPGRIRTLAGLKALPPAE